MRVGQNQRHPQRTPYPARSGRLAWRQRPYRSQKHLARVAAARARTQRPGKHLAVLASDLAFQRVFKSFDDIVAHCCYAWNTHSSTSHGKSCPSPAVIGSAVVRIGIRSSGCISSGPSERSRSSCFIVATIGDERIAAVVNLGILSIVPRFRAGRLTKPPLQFSPQRRSCADWRRAIVAGEYPSHEHEACCLVPAVSTQNGQTTENQ
jgi:hypothetical protein